MKLSTVANQISNCYFLRCEDLLSVATKTATRNILDWRRRNIVLLFPFTVRGLRSYFIALCTQTIGMTKNTPQPYNHSFLKPQRWTIIIPGWRSSGEHTVLLPRLSGIFKWWKINCMACWWAPLKCPFCFDSKHTAGSLSLSFSLSQTTENSLPHITENC